MLRKIIITTFSVLAGLLAGFYVVFNAIFSDVFGFGQHALLLILTLGVYAVMGLVFTLADNQRWMLWIRILSFPAVILVILYSISELGSRVFLHLAYAATATLGTVLGSWSGWKIRVKQHPDDYTRIVPQLRSMSVWLAAVALVGVIIAVVFRVT